MVSECEEEHVAVARKHIVDSGSDKDAGDAAIEGEGDSIGTAGVVVGN